MSSRTPFSLLSLREFQGLGSSARNRKTKSVISYYGSQHHRHGAAACLPLPGITVLCPHTDLLTNPPTVMLHTRNLKRREETRLMSQGDRDGLQTWNRPPLQSSCPQKRLALTRVPRSAPRKAASDETARACLLHPALTQSSFLTFLWNEHILVQIQV